MTLKEAIADDIDVVLDLDDFAEEALVEGKRVKVQFDSARLGELAGHMQDALALDAVTMFARTGDLPAPRKPGDLLMVGNADWVVLSWEDRGGITEITMQRTL